MKELLEYIAKEIVENPDEVEVIQEEEEEGKIVLKLKVADDDKGRIIGKRGRIAESIRAILRVKAVKTDKHVFLDIV
jgi:predicted RNA-binding protein YlqC (UPF0109 family)